MWGCTSGIAKVCVNQLIIPQNRINSSKSPTKDYTAATWYLTSNIFLTQDRHKYVDLGEINYSRTLNNNKKMLGEKQPNLGRYWTEHMLSYFDPVSWVTNTNNPLFYLSWIVDAGLLHYDSPGQIRRLEVTQLIVVFGHMWEYMSIHLIGSVVLLTMLRWSTDTFVGLIRAYTRMWVI